MGSSAETKKASGPSQKIIIIVSAIVIAVLLVVVVALLSQRQLVDIEDGSVPKIGYASDAKVMLDQDSLQAAFNEAVRNAAEGNIGLKYRNDAYSQNGTDFQCYIANSDANIYDMFLTIFADQELTDQVFLSGLVRPGSGFESITLEHALEKGDHTVFVVLTQVTISEETGEQVIKNQVTHTMDFHVTG